MVLYPHAAYSPTILANYIKRDPRFGPRSKAFTKKGEI